MNSLLAQTAVNTPNETVLMVIGILACIGSFALLLWKRDIRNAH